MWICLKEGRNLEGGNGTKMFLKVFSLISFYEKCRFLGTESIIFLHHRKEKENKVQYIIWIQFT